jgi:hypothetical protein
MFSREPLHNYLLWTVLCAFVRLRVLVALQSARLSTKLSIDNVLLSFPTPSVAVLNVTDRRTRSLQVCLQLK